jgi:hypothetical protein
MSRLVTSGALQGNPRCRRPQRGIPIFAMFSLIFMLPLAALMTLVIDRYVVEQMFLTNQDNRDMRDLRVAIDQCYTRRIQEACDDIEYTNQLLKDKGWCTRYYPHRIGFRRCDQPWLFNFELVTMKETRQ